MLVVGCGGTGSSILGGLPYLHQAMLVQGHPYGLHVTVMDGDKVSPFNCVRQPFSQGEIGLYKGICPGEPDQPLLGIALESSSVPSDRTDAFGGLMPAMASRLCARTSWWVVWTRAQPALSSPRVLQALAAWATGSISATVLQVDNSCWVNLRTRGTGGRAPGCERWQSSIRKLSIRLSTMTMSQAAARLRRLRGKNAS